MIGHAVRDEYTARLTAGATWNARHLAEMLINGAVIAERGADDDF